MAHVTVVRRSMDITEWIEIRTKWLKDKCVLQSRPLSGWKIREARQTDEMTYAYYDKEERPIAYGDEYFTPDGTVFLSLDSVIPKAWMGQKVWFSFQTASEMIVKINGSWKGGLDPNRKRICVRKKGENFQSLKIEMEGYNRSKPDDERNPETSALRGCRQIFPDSEIQVIDEQILEAYYDAKILCETITGNFIQDDVRDLIKQELHKALLLIPFETEDRKILCDGIREFRNHLNKTIFSEENRYHVGKIALVAHSHLDIAYFWRRIHCIQKNARTCLIQLDLMDQYPDFKYAHTQAYTYETLQKYFPEIFDRLKERVLQGRFELAGGMYIEPDCNIPTAESLVRQCLYGQHYFQDTFNQTVSNCWLPDVFGNSWILPQILRKAGMEYFVSNKMSTWNDTNLFPHNHFKWRGIDGSDVLACVPPTHFISWNTPDQIIENWKDFLDKDVCPESLNMFGYGDGGSGVTEEMLAYMERLNKIPSLPKTRHIRGDEFLKESIVRDQDLSEWDGELYLEMHRGTFTTKGFLKKNNRKFELMLRDVEYLQTLVYLKTGRYEQEKLDQLWKCLLINQFHDILPGTHIAPVERDVRKDYAYIGETLERLIDNSMLTLSDENQSESIQLINTLGTQRCELCFIKAEHVGSLLISGQPGTYQGQKGFWVQPGPIKAYGSVNILMGKSDIQEQSFDWYSWIGDRKLETPFYSIVFDEMGRIVRLFSKKYKKTINADNKMLGDLQIYHDYPGMYDAWDILENYKDKKDSLEIVEPLSLMEKGALYISFRTILKVGHSIFNNTIRIYHHDEMIDFDFDVDWHEKHRLAKLEFNFNILSRKAGCDTSAGTVYRDTHKNTSWQQARFEVCMHKYVDLYEPGLGVALLNDSKYGVSLDKNQVGISLIRGTVRPDNQSDMGEHQFSISLYPHENSLEESGVIERAWAKNVPLLVNTNRYIPDDVLGLVHTEELHLQSLKKKQRDGSIICRFVELYGKRGEARLTFNREIKNMRVMNLLEEPGEEEDKLREVKGKKALLSYKPFEIITLEVEFY